MHLTMPTRKFARRVGYVAVMGLAPLLASHIDLASGNRAFDGLGPDIGVAGDVVNGLAAASPDHDPAGWIRLSYRFPGTKTAKKKK
jgi:hypothetical protein